MFLFTSIVLYATALQLVLALPVVKRIVIDPPITSPNANTVWTPGNSELVTWDTSAIPSTGNFTGMLVLGHQSAGSENLDIERPLESGFSLRDGSVHVTCPTVSPGNTYIVVLFGDSGNASPQFTISGPSASNSSGSAPSPDSVASPSTQLSSTGVAPPSSASTSSTTSAPLLLMASTSASDHSAPASMTTTVPTEPQDKSSPAGHTTLSTSLSGSDSSSASTVSISPAAGLNTNNATPRILNPGSMIAVVVSVFTIFFL